MDLGFAVTGVEPQRFASLPTLSFHLEITRSGGGPVRSISLTTAIRIAVTGRRYSADEQRALAELFGTPERWGTTLRPLAWAQTTLTVPPFEDSTTVELTVPCGYDTELAVTKYLRAVREGEVPLDFLFSGTVFFTTPQGLLSTARISWARQTACRLPAALWHELMDRYYGESPWLRLSPDTYELLDGYRSRRMLTGWDETVRHLLAQAAADPGRTP
ncbi:hypothetical protein E4099_01705 [Streptomyces palmae]|uniref:Uncharacterized protein n=1 Tax=Streptomyces palmae TaxID=1701085 RepID=A0A4Z0HI97_9ACTN|nr:hypothetical protein E4099_01705 [Streptomyces palmae]